MKPIYQVERGEGSREVGKGCGEAEPAAYPPDEPGAYGVVGDKEHPALDLAAGEWLRHVVEGGGETEPLDALPPDAGFQPVLFELALHAPHDLEGVLEGVEVVVRALFDAPREGELRDGGHEPSFVERGFERLEEAQGSYRRRRAFLRLVFGLGRPFRVPGSSSESSAVGLACLLLFCISAMRRLRLRSTKA